MLEIRCLNKNQPRNCWLCHSAVYLQCLLNKLTQALSRFNTDTYIVSYTATFALFHAHQYSCTHPLTHVHKHKCMQICIETYNIYVIMYRKHRDAANIHTDMQRVDFWSFFFLTLIGAYEDRYTLECFVVGLNNKSIQVLISNLMLILSDVFNLHDIFVQHSVLISSCV